MAYELVNPEELGEPRGWTHGMLAPAGGRLLFVAGQDAAEHGEVITDDFVEQFRVALDKAVTVVREAGGGPESIGRMTLYVTALDEYREHRPEIGSVYRSFMGRHFPAMALVEVSRLVDPRAKVEIEVTAVL